MLKVDSLLEILFDRMHMGIVILDRNLGIQRCNPTWAEFVGQYSPLEACQVVPGVHFFDLAPGSEDELMPLFERVLSGETVHQEAFRLRVDGIVSYWDTVSAPILQDERVVGILHVSIDATQRVLAFQELEQTLETLREREAHLCSLLENATDMAGSTAPCKPLASSPAWIAVTSLCFPATGQR